MRRVVVVERAMQVGRGSRMFMVLSGKVACCWLTVPRAFRSA